ncbi:MAG: choice-of-anchor Q domain-containing protein [Thermodesulfobacteriota bacterium]|nr:choice-of-anchor Q domain-containing protein [Thermodesulfobacteriota bacterium]
MLPVAAVSDEVTVSNATELQNAINNAKGGDTILLNSGNYDNLRISNFNNSSVIIIKADKSATPVFSSVSIQNSSYWSLKGFVVKPRYTNDADGKIAVELNGQYLVFENSTINFADDISGWTASNWLARTGNGIRMGGAHLAIRNNMITNVDHGIDGGATDSLVSGNRIVNFRGDGIRGLGDRMVYEYNTIKNAYEVDGNHDDGFQSWSIGGGGVGTGVVRDVTLRGNIIINFENPNQPLKSTLQGIGLFDGMYENWIIENNIIITNHWHGITMMGAKDSRVVNNTVLDLDTVRPGPPWIRISDHKDGTHSSGVIVRNNLSTDFSLGAGVTSDHNIELGMNELSTYFVNPSGGDYHLKSISPAIDAGSADNAPGMDIEGTVRPQGVAWDVGAYEFSVDGGVISHIILLLGSSGK